MAPIEPVLSKVSIHTKPNNNKPHNTWITTKKNLIHQLDEHSTKKPHTH